MSYVEEGILVEKTIYHGSKDVIQSPVFGKGKRYNDYGLGFYCTENIELAKEWAVDSVRDGYVNEYKIDCDELEIMNLTSLEYTILHWLNILLENREFDLLSPLAREAREYIQRTFPIPYKEYDIIVGYRADDSYFSFAQDFLNGTISYRQLNQAMHLGRLGEQVVLKSRKAFDRLVFAGYEPVAREVWYPKRELRDWRARREYFDLDKNRYRKGDIYIISMIDEEMEADDVRLR